MVFVADRRMAVKMKAYELQSTSGISGLMLVEKPVPKPGIGEVLVRIRAASLNYRDLLILKGGYGSHQKLPLIPLSDGAGMVEEIGPAVRQFKPGDRVIGSFFENWLSGEPTREKLDSALGGAIDGVLAEYRIFRQEALVLTPSHLSDTEAASLPCAGLTAWNAVVSLGRVKPGDIVLTQGTGGVSLFALQFAKMSGARVISTSSTEDKIARLKQLGADQTINYVMVREWGKRAREFTDARGVDLVVEVGGSGTLNESIRATRIGGSIALIGVLAGPAQDVTRLPLIVMQQQRIQGVTVGSVETLQSMVDAIAVNKMHPNLDQVFAFENAKEAFAHMEAGRHFGKIVIAIP
jgi:NADPH:quinone reductase-like Zn-dependent oxidoreductase